MHQKHPPANVALARGAVAVSAASEERALARTPARAITAKPITARRAARHTTVRTTDIEPPPVFEV
jgi:hypothetical protein